MLWYRVRLRNVSSMCQRLTTRSFVLICAVLILVLFVLKTSKNQSNFTTCSTPIKPIIFIGGMPRSGTTLMRAILDSHPMVRCGEETRIIPRILGMRMAWERSKIEWNRLISGGINEQVMDAAVRAFIYETLLQHNKNSDVFCDKDPFILKNAFYLSSLFPNGKFIFMIRDPRAVVHSVMTRKVTITGFSMTDYRLNFKLWNKGVEVMHEQCLNVTSNKCLMVFYEQLVLQPVKTIRMILQFLDLPWVEQVLHHEELVGTRISLSRAEHSSDQVVQPINLEGLSKWIGRIPVDVQEDLDLLAPMLTKLGYDVRRDHANYGTADRLVLKNMDRLKTDAEYWEKQKLLYSFRAANLSEFVENLA